MNTSHNTIQDAIAEIEMLSKEGFTSFKLFRENTLWRVQAI